MKKQVLSLTVLLIGVLVGCGSQRTPLTGADKDAVLAYSEGKTDNLLAGMNANNYTMFSQDFDQDMVERHAPA